MSQEEKNKKYLHALTLMPFLGPRRIKSLLDYFKTPWEAWRAFREELVRLNGFGPSVAETFVRERSKIDPDQIWEEVKKKNISVVAWDDPAYPYLLKEIYDPPPLLYFQGDLNVLQKSCLAIVGSRRHTVYGKEIAYKFAQKISNYDLTIVSGMARGIDTWAHRGVLDGGGKTAAVLGCGLDICYPAENRNLKKKILENGVVVSEFPPGVGPMPQHFPQRNRIISGLSLGTLVVEAGEKSGSLITAGFALDQGREVFAVPGAVGSPFSRGCHKLLKEGAKLVETVEDILEELIIPLKNEPVIPETVSYQQNMGEKVSELLDLIPYEPLLLEEIISRSKRNPSEVYLLLLDLELSGKVRQLPGKYYMRI